MLNGHSKDLAAILDAILKIRRFKWSNYGRR